MENVNFCNKEFAKKLYIWKKQTEVTLFFGALVSPFANYAVSSIYLKNIKVIDDSFQKSENWSRTALVRKTSNFYCRFTDNVNPIMTQLIKQSTKKELQLLYALNKEIECTPFTTNISGYNLKNFSKTLKIFNDSRLINHCRIKYPQLFDNAQFDKYKLQINELFTKVKTIHKQHRNAQISTWFRQNRLFKYVTNTCNKSTPIRNYPKII